MPILNDNILIDALMVPIDYVLDFYNFHIRKWSFGEKFLAMENRELLRCTLRDLGFVWKQLIEREEKDEHKKKT